MAMVSDHTDIRASTITTPRASQFIDDHMPIMLKLVCICSMKTSPLLASSLDLESDGEVVDDGDRLAVERAGLELPLADRFHGGVVEPHRQRLEHAQIGHV